MRSARQTPQARHGANDIAMCPISESKVNAALDALYEVSATVRVCRVAIDAVGDNFNLSDDVKKDLFDVAILLQSAGKRTDETTEYLDAGVWGQREVTQ